MTTEKIAGTKEAFLKMISERGVYKKLGVTTVTVAKLYPNIDTALEGIYRPFSERKKQIDKL